MTVKLVFDKGQVVSVDAGGSGDREAEACVTKVLHAVTLAGSSGRVTATISLASAEPLPAAKKVAFFADRNRKVLENIIDANTLSKLQKFQGLPGPGVGTGTGTGVGVGTGTGTGTTRGRGTGGGGNAEGDFVAVRPGVRDPSAPQPREVKIQVGTQSGDLGDRPAEQVHRVIAARLGIFRACYQKELNRTPDIAGKLVLQFTIDPSGTVTRVLVAPGTTLASEPVAACMTSNVMRFKFPQAEKAAEVTFPFVFTAGR
jgi:hypothetical protein